MAGLGQLTDALHHLRAFRHEFGCDDVIDRRSGLTAEHISVVIDLLERIDSAAASMIIVPPPGCQ